MSARAILVSAALALAALGAAGYGIAQRRTAVATLQAEADERAVERVGATVPRPGPKERHLTLPGQIAAWNEAQVYGQVSGYVSQWFKDYGAPVKQGDLLATVAAPGLDAEFAAAKASLDVATANASLSALTASRFQALRGSDAVTQQDIDNKVAAARADTAQVDAARENVDRYQALMNFKRIVSPLDGIVTARRVNVGDFINASGADATLRGKADPPFSVGEIDKLRVFVSVPQVFGSALQPGLRAVLHPLGQPGRTVPATFRATAAAVQQATRTIVTEFALDNPGRDLWPGAYVDVELILPGNPDLLIVPAQALLFRAQGMQVAVVDAGSHVHLRDVALGNTLGLDVEILSGLKPDDRIVANPTLGLLDGAEVRVVTPTPGYAPGAAPSTGSAQASTD